MQHLGPYRVIEQIASGGMGTVYLAEQPTPRRLVAVKVVRSDREGARILDRFRQELEALAEMDHPSIARVYDAARLPDGRSYFVMEYVDGPSITEFAKRNALTLGARVDLFLEVCDAVRHAHQRGVIHRDIKPSNVLVATEDGRARPKLIDFGIARAVGGRAGGLTLVGEVVGTPAYMSPEQTVPGAPIDTRTDVYGLGIVFYELLSGCLPDPAVAEGKEPIDVVFRRIREEDPPFPSARGGMPALRGDLDAIILKAIAKKPDGRYVTVDALSEDVRRHRRSEPVLARRRGTLYSASRFLRRHRWGTLASGLLLALGVAAAIAAIQQGQVARGRVYAQNREVDANAVAAFLSEVFSSASPRRQNSRNITVREAVDLASDHALKTYGQVPAVRGMILSMLGQVQISLGRYDKASTLLTEATRVLYMPPGSESAVYAEALVRLGNVEMLRRDLDGAAQHLGTALAARKRLFGEDSVPVGEVLADLGEHAWWSERPKDARSLYEEALAIFRRRGSANDVRIGNVLRDLGDVAQQLEEPERAFSYYTEAERIFAVNPGKESLDYAVLQNNFGLLFIEKGQWDDARRALDEALRISEKAQGADHWDLAETLNAVGRIALHDGDVGRAETIYRRALQVARQPWQDAVRAESRTGLEEVARRTKTRESASRSESAR